MNKTRTSLALSLSVLAGQACALTTQPASAADAIWQKMSGSKGAKTQKSAPKVRKAAQRKPANPAVVKKQIADNHVMLFLNGKNKPAELAEPPAAAALSIHTTLDQGNSLFAGADNPIATKSSPLQIAHSAIPSPTSSSNDEASQLIAQLAPDNTPDHLIAQSTSSGVTATPIPPVVTGAVDLEEFKTTNVIDLKVSQSRTFKMRNKIVRTSISDPGIAEPVVVAENQMVLLGKAPGSCTMVLWDDAGNTAAVDIVVNRDYSELQTALREIDPRIIVKAFSVGGSDRVILLGDVDHVESVIRAFLAANVFMDDRGLNIQVNNNRLVNARIGEQGAQGGAGGAGGTTGQLAQIANVDRYTFFGNTNNNITKAQVITSDGGRVTSLVKIRKAPLIVLHVTFMEMNTTTARELATALGIGNSSRGFAFGVGGVNNAGSAAAGVPTAHSVGGFTFRAPTATVPAAGTMLSGAGPVGIGTGYASSPVGFYSGNQLTISGQQNNYSAISQGVPLTAPQVLQSAILFGAPGGTTFAPTNILNLFNSVNNFALQDKSRWSVNPQVEGLITMQRARILSEPSLVCVSGERASMLAGGEIPIIQAVAAAGQAQQSVVFEPFGLRINFIPVLTESGAINLEVSPEERIPSTQNGLQLTGSSTIIPSFTTRKAQTIVDMKPGQELFIGGLITSNNGRELTKLPLIGEVPVLGAIYRSKAFAKNESELVVAVRPEIILPGTPGQLKLPEEIGRVEGPRDMNMFQVEPTVLDERHYSTGRAERHQKTSPTLPEGAPVPDSD